MYIHACLHIHMYAPMYMHLLNVHTPMHACTHTCMRMHMHVYIYAFTYTPPPLYRSIHCIDKFIDSHDILSMHPLPIVYIINQVKGYFHLRFC